MLNPVWFLYGSFVVLSERNSIISVLKLVSPSILIGSFSCKYPQCSILEYTISSASPNSAVCKQSG